jgi:C4-type Zn-finger protein
LKKNIEEDQKREDIICPYCGEVQDNDSRYHYVTYWGEDGEKDCDCESCGKTFSVEEEVTRRFECKEKETNQGD